MQWPRVSALLSLLLAPVAAVAVFGNAIGYAQDDRIDSPPLDPGVEVPADNPSFVEKCLDDITPRMKLQVWPPVVLTKNDKWGLVVRADFTVPGNDPGPYV